MIKYLTIFLFTILILSSCEEVIDIDLNSANPAFVVEAIIYKDSVCNVKLTQTSGYFSTENQKIIDNAQINISDGISSEELNYKGNGIYKGSSIIGAEGRLYEIEIHHEAKVYVGSSFMPYQTNFTQVLYYLYNDQSILNPTGERVVTISCEFNDNPDVENFYMIRFNMDGSMLDDAYYLLTEENSNIGSFSNENNTIYFAESIFDDRVGEVEVQIFSIDEAIYDYFWQLNDILYWKRQVMPPTPYNPISNISNGALGYFTAWAVDSEVLVLE